MSGTFLHDDAKAASCACLQAQEALIVAGGAIDIDQLAREAAILKAKGVLLIAADRGLEALEAAKLIPDVAVGDFDSVKPEVLENFSRCPGIRYRYQAGSCPVQYSSAAGRRGGGCGLLSFGRSQPHSDGQKPHGLLPGGESIYLYFLYPAVG